MIPVTLYTSNNRIVLLRFHQVRWSYLRLENSSHNNLGSLRFIKITHLCRMTNICKTKMINS